MVFIECFNYKEEMEMAITTCIVCEQNHHRMYLCRNVIGTSNIRGSNVKIETISKGEQLHSMNMHNYV